MKRHNKENASQDALILRLDAILTLLIETNRGKEGFTEASVARALKSVGLTPTEIARIMGKKSATDVSQYLYQKKDKDQNRFWRKGRATLTSAFPPSNEIRRLPQRETCSAGFCHAQ